MRALRKTVPSLGLTFEEVQPPSVTTGTDVLIDVEAVGICGSDVHAFEWTSGYRFLAERLPRTLGHEFSGRIRALGDNVQGLAIGDRVALWPMVPCGHCVSCQWAQPEFCENRSLIGFHHDGGFAEQVVAPAANCFKLPRNIDAEVGALAEPLGVAAHAVEVGRVSIGDTVLVLGAGPIGVGIAWFARRAGATKVILVGRDDAKRLAVAERLGIPHCVDSRDRQLTDVVRDIVGGKVDVVFEATGVPETIAQALVVLRPGGMLVATGIHARPVEFDLTAFVRAKQQLRAAYDSTRATWHRVLSVLEESSEELRPMITHRLPLKDALEGFELARRRDALKVILTPH